ncbi:SDR family oxidoreductase [Actinomadura viridis]|uniref:3-oxoacyl-[acyl-carrier protein] reductase n=1 Tax=Actinomadura viridis TaxID=58110 RepID=A0A931DNG2_9ACTN|nr:SDR family oxidoreductase [Actinomadura viridis]MBG6091869.1 3-oxoacyl-[acyl-carrier protein] reductase [Actinomadura viridis]
MIDTRLGGRTALVTGANGPLGIGAAIARALAAEGVRLALCSLPEALPDRPDRYALSKADDGRRVLGEVRALGVEAELFEVDLATVDAADLFERVEGALGPVEILVNNAAYCVPDTFLPDGRTVDGASLDAHHAVNTRAPALLMTEFHRRHLRRGADWGRIVSISTDAAPGAPGEISYWATKNALESLSRSAALEFGAAGITVNIISPGPIQTGWLDGGLEGEVAALSPLGRVGHPEDIADIAVFLASHQGRWLTGQTILAGGGKRMI